MSVVIPADIIKAAQASAKAYRVPASVSLAQWALESGWGAHATGTFNYFGIKASAAEPGRICVTHEEVDGKVVAVLAKFRDFGSVEDAFDHHAELIADAPVYRTAMTMVGHVEAFVREVARHYATDTDYADKIMTIIRTNNLFRYDAHTI